MFGQQVVNGLVIGMIYGLLALGFSLAYSTTRVVNFAHGELFTVGAVLGLICQRSTAIPFALIAILVTALVFAAATAFTYCLLGKLRTLLDRSIATIALGLLLRDGMLVGFGSDSESYLPVYPIGAVTFAELTVPKSSLIIAAITVVLFAAFVVLIRCSRWGIWMQATAQDECLAALSGIATRRVGAFAFGIGAGLAALAGVLIGPTWQVQYATGTMIGLKAFTAALVGGLGNLYGALLGGLLLGMLEALLAGYVSSTWKDLAVYSSLLLVLVLFPSGIFAARKPRVG